MQLISSASNRIHTAFRPSTRSSHSSHFKTFLAFTVFFKLPASFSLHNILRFLEFLRGNSISPKVIRNYLSCLRSMAKLYRIPSESLYHHSVNLYMCSITINSTFRPIPRGSFDIPTLLQISQACDSLSDPLLLRAAFLLAFFGFLRMSNIAPHSIAAFDYSRHLNRQDVIFAPPGAHVLIKWAKTLQDRVGHHIVQIPQIHHPYLCPVQALLQLLQSRPLPPTFPLFASKLFPHHPIIDTKIRDALKCILTILKIDLKGHGFHTFRRSGATLAFDCQVPLQNIMAHGLWKSSSVWTYLQNASTAASTIPSTFASVIPSSL